MKIIVFSDSHGYLDHMKYAIKQENPNYIIHLGDHVSDAEALCLEYPMLPIMRVRGNCDRFDVTWQESATAVYDGVKVWATHGHKYGVKSSLLRLFMAAKESAVRIALFGHTHCAYCEEKEGIWLLNPGTCGYFGHSSYGLIHIEGGLARCEIINCEKGER